MDAWLMIIGIFFTLFLIIGTVGNSIMILAFIRSTKLRTICHFLIAFLCFADLLHSLSHVPNVITIFSGWEIRQASCFYLQAIFLAGAVSSSPICFLLGLDRFLAIAYPFYYQQLQRRKTRTLALYSLLPILYTALLLYSSYSTSSYENVRLCAVPTALNPYAFSILNLSFIAIQVLACCLYFVSWILLRRKTVEKTFRRIFKSILITVFLIIFGWLTTGLLNLATFLWIPDSYTRTIIQMFAGFFVNSSLCTNVFVYYHRNTEYREAIRAVLFKEKESSRMNSAQQEPMLNSNNSSSV